MRNKLLVFAWIVVVLWGIDALFTLYTARWTGLVIALTGMAASLLVVAAFHSRSHKDPYPNGRKPAAGRYPDPTAREKSVPG